MRIQVRRPNSPWGWLELVPLVLLALVLLLFGLAFSVLVLLVSPILVWWQRRKGPPGAPQGQKAAGKVIEVEYTVKEERAE